ncbi:CARDB domain-containing protein [Kineococcus aurantiacus]|uniref:CARDB domain-containing protein n=1 Tax=Kineococcus aurantiacus TaxID=37633 RepID=A0A7Y9DQN0_9ACTN|nr:hypothetical protein [Kineococcus aurantiacus]
MVAATLLGAGTAHAAPARPDLVVTAVGWGPQQTTAHGNPLTFTATIENQGTAPTPAGVIHGVGFQVDGTLRTWSDTWTLPLQPGESRTVEANSGPTGSRTWTATTGTHEVLAYVDDAGRIVEANEANNRTKKQLTVAATGPVVSSTYRNGAPFMKLASLPYKTGLASSISGTGYAACYTGGVVRWGSEKAIGAYGAGNWMYHQDSSWGWSGIADVPARATPIASSDIDLGEIVRWNYGDPAQKLTCNPGETPDFTRLHATAITTNRYAIAANGYNAGALLGTYTGPLNIDLPI